MVPADHLEFHMDTTEFPEFQAWWPRAIIRCQQLRMRSSQWEPTVQVEGLWQLIHTALRWA